MSQKLLYLGEPDLKFAFDQQMEDPRDGLTLFGPLEGARPYGVRAGVIGTERGIELFRNWVRWVQRPVFHQTNNPSRPIFPGFSAAFRTEWSAEPHSTIVLTDQEIDERLQVKDAHKRVYGMVGLYAERILAFHREEDSRPDLWFVIIPDRVKTYCRPQSQAPAGSVDLPNQSFRTSAQARAFRKNMSLFEEMAKEADVYLHDVDFHNQLKARLLPDQIITQGVKERTLSNIVTSENDDFSKGEVAMQSDIAWRLSTAVFYKCGGKPWKLAHVRPGVCYVGLVFKQDHTNPDPRWSCCAAQMFLDSGDGLVFKGALGPWRSEETRQFHLTYDAAKDLVTRVVAGYEKTGKGELTEIFIHGRASFDKKEILGFQDATGGRARVTGVTIKKDKTLKLFRASGNRPLLRGSCYASDARAAYLWANGYVPRLQTYPGWEVPNALRIQTRDHEAQIETIARDVLMLTKLNYNACNYGDGVPVTLKFADAVGEILTAAPMASPPPPLPFRHYI